MTESLFHFYGHNYRGVLYTESIPFNIIGPVVCVGTIGGLGYKYIGEALTWED